VIKIVENEPVFRGSEKFYEMTREEQMELQMKRVKRMAEMGFLAENLTTKNKSLPLHKMMGINPLFLHCVMFSLSI